MSRKRGVFTGQRKDRLGARLLMMLTCIRLAEDFDTDYRVNWFPQGADAPELENPSELFTKDWMQAQFLDSPAFDALNKTALPIWSFLNDKTPDRLLAHLADGRSVLVEEGFEVLSFPWEDIEAIRPRYRAFIHQIGFTPELRAIMDKADAALSDKGVSAYHIRRGDILNGLPWKHTTWPAKIEPEELYEAHLDKHPGRPAIMFSDQPELITRFKARYPDLMQMSDIADLSKLSRAKRDFIELYTMSRADKVIAPYISAFSMAAARISGHQRKVFRDVLTEEDIDRANDQAIARVKKGADAFLNRSEAAHIYAKVLFNLYKLGQEDRAIEAFEMADRLLAAGSENAFLPLLQSLNCFYLNRWDEAAELVDQALSSSELWPEDYAVALALRAALFGEQKKRWRAGQEFSRAFWAKPIRPDVLVFGSRLLYRDQLSLRLMPPSDWSLQKVIRRPWFNFNSHVAQREVLKRLPCNFDFLLLDWAELSLDQKARRLTGDRPRLEMLQAGLHRMTDIPDDDPRVQSFACLLAMHLGQIPCGEAIDQARTVVTAQSENPLYHKRLSDLYEADGDVAQARLAMADALACDPENPFLVFAMGRLLVRIGSTELGENQIINAAELDESTAAIQGMAGQILLKRGKKNKARRYLRRAHELFPPYKRFANQLKRAER